MATESDARDGASQPTGSPEPLAHVVRRDPSEADHGSRDPQEAAQERRRSLRWRLPLSLSALVAVVLAAFLWAAYRELEGKLVAGGTDRAEAAAHHLSSLLERSTERGVTELNRLAADPAVAALAGDSGEAELEAARELLLPAVQAGGRRLQVWARDGRPLLELVSEQEDAEDESPLVLPPEGSPPAGVSLGPLRLDGDAVYSEAVVAVPDPSGPDAPPLAWLMLRTSLVSGGGDELAGLLGEGATVRLGNADGSVWTDLKELVDGPPAGLLADGQALLTDATGAEQVSALARIAGTPWAVWIDLPRAAITAPADRFLRSMLGLGLLFVLLAALLVRWVTGRMTRPLADLTAAAEQMAAGDYSSRVRAERPDEIGRLGAAFNSMAQQVASDIGRRERAEASLREREASFHALFSKHPLPMWLHELGSGRIVEVNEAALRGYGHSRSEFLALQPGEIEPEPEGARHVSAETDSRGNVAPARVRHRLRSGELIEVESSTQVLPFEGRPVGLVVAQDLTDRLRLEEQLRQAQKMEAVGRLAGGIAHDFNNLLTGIFGHVEFALDEARPGGTVHQSLLEIQTAAQSAAALTGQLLAFSRRQVQRVESLDLNAIVQRMESLLSRVIGEGVSLRCRLEPALDPVMADRGQIEQVIMNLAVNSRDAMPDGGELSIDTANVELDESYVPSHAGSAVGPHVMIAVSDTGAGMSPDAKARLFEPFFTTKPVGEGTGLGLSTVYGIVKQSGGSIWVYSEPGRGTTFKVYFPRALTTADAGPPRLEAPLERGSETVLLAEDQAEVRTIAANALRRQGYRVLEAADPDLALGLSRSAAEPIDLLLTDVVMPGMSGRELAELLLADNPELRVLYTSGYTDDTIVRRGVLQGEVAFLQKPFTPRALATKVRAVLDAAPPAPAVEKLAAPELRDD